MGLSLFQRIVPSIFWTVTGKFFLQIILFAISILITRYLGKDRLGIYATLLVIPAFVRLLNQFGLETLINKKLPELNVKDPTGGTGRFLIRRLLTLRLVSSLVFCAALYFFLPYYLGFIHMPDLLIYRPALILYFFAITTESMLSTLFMTLLRYKVVSMVEILSGLTNLVLLGIFTYLDSGIFGILYAYILSVGLSIIIYLLLSLKDIIGESRPPGLEEMRPLAATSYGISLLSFGLLNQSDVLLMNYFQVDPAGVGYYHLATGLGGMLGFVLTGTGPLALSVFSEAFARESRIGLSRSWCGIVGFSAFVSVPVHLFVFFNSGPLLAFIYGEQYRAAAGALSLYVLFAGSAVVMGTYYTVSTLFVLGKRDVAMRSTIEASVLNVGLNLVLIPLYGYMGAIGATGFVMVYMALRQLHVIRKEIDLLPVIPMIGKSFFCSFIAIFPVFLASRVAETHFMTNAAIFFLSFLLVLIWIKPLSSEQRSLLVGMYPRSAPWVRFFVRQPLETPVHNGILK